jgi:hypothetical protein
MLSGVGPLNELETYKIPVILDLPSVGANLVDHPVVDIAFKDKLDASTKHVNPSNPWQAIKALGSLFNYLVFGSGPMATNVWFIICTDIFEYSLLSKINRLVKLRRSSAQMIQNCFQALNSQMLLGTTQLLQRTAQIWS